MKLTSNNKDITFTHTGLKQCHCYIHTHIGSALELV